MPKSNTQSSSTYLARRHWTPEDASRALAAMARSGLGLTAFAIREGLDPQRLTRWRRRLESSASASPAFEEVVPSVVATAIDGNEAVRAQQERLEIVLRSGRVVRVPDSFDALSLRRLLDVVDEARAC